MPRKKTACALVPLCFKVPAPVKEKLRRRAFKERKSISSLVCKIVVDIIQGSEAAQ